MKLFVLLLCIGLERYFETGSILKRFNWFNQYVLQFEEILIKRFKLPASTILACIILPIIISIMLFIWFTSSWLWGLFGLLTNMAILLYCLGPDDLHHQLLSYFAAKDSSDDKAAKKYYQQLVGDGDISPRTLTKVILNKANDRFFAVIFWFIILGPLGAVFYRLSSILREREELFVSTKMVTSELKMLNQILIWAPVRLTTLFFNLVGNFHESFPHWCQNVFSRIESNHELLLDCGLKAINADSKGNIEENKSALKLVDNSLVLYLILIALFTIGAFIS